MKKPFLSKANHLLAASYLHQQCWCWGCDIRHPDGNVLLNMGFVRHHVKAKEGSNCYELHLKSGCTVFLWGFGFGFIKKNGSGIYVNRYEFSPVILKLNRDEVRPWLPVQLNIKECSTTSSWRASLATLKDAIEWISVYELEVRNIYGNEYRIQCLKKLAEADKTIGRGSLEWHLIASLVEKSLNRCSTAKSVADTVYTLVKK